MTDRRQPRHEETYEDFERYERWSNNFAPWTRFANWTPAQRLNAARDFGENWASILSGIGDQ